MSNASTKMVVPETITVGFQKRNDTYTGKLAYIIYTDSKGILRKEGSWNSWRDKKIESVTFKNEPTPSFVLNKKVGGYRMDWNHRQTYVRVYDSRDFEFEITIPNLLFILQETSAIKGKGLEGEFVYAWNGKDLFLLPTGCKEYQECVNFTKVQAKKVDKADKIPGNIFLMKDMTQVMYLGRLPFAEKYGYNDSVRYMPVGLKHVFKKLESGKDEEKYIALDGFVKIAERVSDSVSPDFDLTLLSFKKSRYHDEAVAIKYEPIGPITDYNSHRCFVKIGDKFHPAYRWQQRYGYSYRHENDYRNVYQHNDEPMPEIVKGVTVIPKFPTDRYYYSSSHEGKLITNEEFFQAILTTKKGHEVNITRDRY